jgi:hypothetical protein
VRIYDRAPEGKGRRAREGELGSLGGGGRKAAMGQSGGAQRASLFVEKSLRRQVRAAHGRGCAAKTD